MYVLAVNSATSVASVAVVNEEKVVSEFFLNTSKTHSERLMPLIDELLKYSDLKLSDIDAFAVAIGPGSFTGLRIGLATVKGLAFFTEKPVVGVSTLDGLAANLPYIGGLICPVIYSKSNEVYAAVYINSACGLERISPYLAVSPEKLVLLLEKFDKRKITLLGDALDMFNENMLKRLGAGLKIAPKEHRIPKASTIGCLGMEKLKKGCIDKLEELVPFYIRASAAEEKRKGKCSN
ncbi:MAG TPA: tRNA (adenosine(37)-N6)-threonylcarbamoyltransferase complex dimerization subunit type 1 TsaB [Peptococcaceae bacterium]|nr:MAG: Peptidase M22 glycoprotease [Clostridia bacterium 41_269]HBT20768.1 tRNA (adenosine(37)-N6)-threonylcarbamoyltransferase complex dimerization subunit type 1 TsaB [Peptococcaceae bacterium]